MICSWGDLVSPSLPQLHPQNSKELLPRKEALTIRANYHEDKNY